MRKDLRQDFAVLGLARDWLENKGLTPDYKKAISEAEVFKRFALWNTYHSRVLEFCRAPLVMRYNHLSCWAGRT